VWRVARIGSSVTDCWDLERPEAESGVLESLVIEISTSLPGDGREQFEVLARGADGVTRRRRARGNRRRIDEFALEARVRRLRGGDAFPGASSHPIPVHAERLGVGQRREVVVPLVGYVSTGLSEVGEKQLRPVLGVFEYRRERRTH